MARKGKFNISRKFRKGSKKFSAKEVISVESSKPETKSTTKSSFAAGTSTGKLVYSSSTKRLYLWNGTEWSAISSGPQYDLTLLDSPSPTLELDATGNTSTISMKAINHVYDSASYISDVEYSYHMLGSNDSLYRSDGSTYPPQLTGLIASGYETTGNFVLTPSTTEANAGSFTLITKAFDGSSFKSAPTLINLSFGLFDFTTHTFTTGNTTNTGEHRATNKNTFISAYSGAGFENNSDHFNVLHGIQLWKVPSDGNYEFEVASAGGGSNNRGHSGGTGRVIKGTKSLTRGTVIRIIVGNRGGRFQYTAGGGGASVVSLGNSMSNATPAASSNGAFPWIMPGAGGGAGDSGGNGYNANSGESATNAHSYGANTSVGTGGRNGQTGNGGWGGGGSGWASVGGGNNNSGSTGYQAHYNAGPLNQNSEPYGAWALYSNPFYNLSQGSCNGAAGGFGGGGNGACNGGGAGAGYTGGNSGGSGGGSYFNTSEMSGRVDVGTIAANTDGYVKITKL